jgi:invasion protein IalB
LSQSHEFKDTAPDEMGHGHARSANLRLWAWRVGFAVVFMVVGGALALLGQKLTSGPSHEMSVQRFQDWRVVCAPADDKGQGGGCAMSAQIIREDGGTLLSLSINDTAPGSQMSVVVPHGVLLDPGLGFSVGDGALKVLPYETCMPAGCLVLVGLDSETLKAMKASTSGQIVVVPGNGSPVTIPFSLKGFAEGFAALEEAKDRRSSMWSFLER